MDVLKKLIQYFALVIIINIPLHIVFIVLVGNITHAGLTLGVSNEIFVIVSTILLLLLSSYISLRIMKNKFIQLDSKVLSMYVFVVLIVFIFYSYVTKQLDTIEIFYPFLAYVQVRTFIAKKFKGV